MNQQQRIVTSDYQIVDEDEYTVILVYALNTNINIYLPYASNFDKVIILKADNSLNEVFVHLKGNDTFQNSKTAYRLSRPFQLVEFTTDNESAWYAVSTYSSGSAAVGGSGGVSVHADLDGLLANDHPQYLHVSGSNANASNFDMRGFSIFNVLNINDVNILTITGSLDGHILDTNNPHATTFSTLDPGTLAELNSIITDANLDDSGSARTPTLHSASHLSGGSDPISIQQLEARGITEGHLFAAGPNGNIVSFASSAFAPNDHGSLNGLGDLDHPQYETTASFRPYSASVNTFTASVLSFSSSYSTRISDLEAQSGSLTSSVDTLQKASASFRADIGDLQNASASFSSRVTTLENASGTFVTQFTELYAASASFDNASASYAGFSASFVVYSASWSAGVGTDLTALNSFSASIQEQTASIQTFSASILAFSASHGSRHLSGAADAINAQDLGASGLGANRLLMTNPNGGWTTVPSSSVGAGGGATDITALNSFTASLDSLSQSWQAGRDLVTSGSVVAATFDYEVSSSRPPYKEGRTFYDPVEKALSVYNDEPSITHQVGQEGLIRVHNDHSFTIQNGQPVYSYTIKSEGNIARPSVRLAQAHLRETSRVIGIATEDITSGSFGFVTHWGFVNDIDLSSFTNGASVFLSETTSGSFRTGKPPVGNYNVQIGIAVSASVNGRLLVHTEVDQSEASAANLETTSGLISGCFMSYASPTEFSVSAGQAVIVSVANSSNISSYNVVATASVNTISDIGLHTFTWVGLDSGSNVVQIKDRDPSQAEARDYAWLGRLGHPNGALAVNGVANRPFGVIQAAATAFDLARAIGPFSREGNVYSANGANLKLNRSEGTTFLLGSNYQNDPRQPSNIEWAATASISWTYVYKSGSTWVRSGSVTDINPGIYNNLTIPNSASVASNKWTIQRVHFSTTGATIIYLGQVEYNSLDAAIAAVNEPTEVDPSLSETIPRAFVIVRNNAVSLQNTTVNRIIEATSGPGTAQGAVTTGISDHGSLTGLGDLDHPQYETTASFRPYSASVKAFTASIQGYTASVQTHTASIQNFSASIQAFSTSIQAQTASMQSFSASIQSQTASIQVFSASMLAASGAFATISSSYKTFSASYVASSASWSTRIASMTASIVRLDAASGAYSQISSSYKTFSASFVNYSSSWAGVSQSYLGFSASHASRHLSGGADPIDAQNLRANGLPINQLLITNGNGGWTTVASQSVGGAGGGSTDISALNAFSASIQEQTASIQIFSASMLAASGAFATISSSYKTFSASFVNYSASWTAGLGGSPAGGGADGNIRAISNISSTSYFTGSVVGCSGSTTEISVFALVRMKHLPNPPDCLIFHNASGLVNHTGYRIGWLQGFGFYFAAGDGVSSSEFIFGPPNTVENGAKFYLIHGSVSSSTLRVSVNGVAAPGSPTQAYAPRDGKPEIGYFSPFGLGDANDFEIVAVGYSPEWHSSEQMYDYWNAVSVAKDVVTGSLNWEVIAKAPLSGSRLTTITGSYTFDAIPGHSFVEVTSSLIWR